MTNNKVASYAERIERLLDERAAIDSDIKDIYTEVKAADLKPKVLRKSIANKRRKVDAQFEKEVEEYTALLLAMPGATYRSVAEQTGIPKSTLQRRVPRKANGTPLVAVDPKPMPHNPETGEITDSRAVEDDDGEQAGRGGATDGLHSVDPPLASKPESEAGLAGEAEAPAPITETAPDTPPSPAPEFGVGPGTESCGQTAATVSAVGEARVSAATSSPQDEINKEVDDARVATPEPEVARAAPPATDMPPTFSDAARDMMASIKRGENVVAIDPKPMRDDDDLQIPPFLRRSA